MLFPAKSRPLGTFRLEMPYFRQLYTILNQARPIMKAGPLNLRTDRGTSVWQGNWVSVTIGRVSKATQ